jgi:hypothetical protein
MSIEESNSLLEGFTVESAMKEVESRYIEAHDKALNEVREKIEELNEK